MLGEIWNGRAKLSHRAEELGLQREPSLILSSIGRGDSLQQYYSQHMHNLQIPEMGRLQI